GRTGGNLPHGHTAGFLGRQHDPFILNADPNAPNFKVPDLLPPDYISTVRAERRQRLRDAVDGAIDKFEKNAQPSSSTTASTLRFDSCPARRPARRSRSTRNPPRCATATAARASASAA